MLGIDLDFCWVEHWGLHKGERVVIDHLSEEPDEWLLILIVRFGRDVIVLQVLLPVEGDLLGLDLSVLDIDLVAYEHNWDLLTNSGQVLVPLLDVGVGDTGADVEHDDSALSTNVVSISESSELLLACSVPNIEEHLSVGGMEWHGVDLHSQCGNVSLLELSGQVTLDKGGLTDATISDKHKLELWNLSV